MPAATGRPPVNRWIPAIAVMLSAVMEVLDTSVVNVSLPHIAGSLSATVDEATWVLTSYIVANAIILPISGWLANYFGRKRLLMTVVTGFTVSSLMCGVAPNLPALIFFRVMQGTTGGGLQPLSQAVLLEGFPLEERGTAMAFWGLGIVAAPILGPTLGGWLTENYSWRWVFYINLPVGILSLVMIYLYVVDPPYLKRTSNRVDVWGLGLMALGIASFQVMLDKGQEDDWFASHFIVTLAVVALVTLAIFVVRELRTSEPLVDFRLLRFRTYAAGVGVATVLGFVLYGSLVLLPLFMQELLGFSAVEAGFWMSPRGIATGIMMPITGYLLGRRMDPRWMLAVGMIVASLAFFGYSGLDLQAGPTDFLVPQFVQGIGMALVFVPLTTITMDPIPLASTGYATSIYSLMRNMGASMGVSFVTTMVARRSQFHQARLADAVSVYSPGVQRRLEQYGGAMAGRGAPPGVASHQALGVMYRQMLQQAMLMSFVDMFYVLGIMFLVVTPIVWLMRRPTQRAHGAAAAAH
ncbi:MAG: DHA2 family efflux MFS transporter permease subunit [Betaproteobacteria bacterium]